MSRFEIVFQVEADHQPDVRDLAQLLFEGWHNWANKRPKDEPTPIIVGRQVCSEG